MGEWLLIDRRVSYLLKKDPILNAASAALHRAGAAAGSLKLVGLQSSNKNSGLSLLTTDVQPFGEGHVPLEIVPPDVRQQAPALPDHH